MTIKLQHDITHLVRRGGFGISKKEFNTWSKFNYREAVDHLVDYEKIPDNVDSKIGKPGYIRVKPADAFDDHPTEAKLVKSQQFNPNENLVDGLQRWQFRMLHSERPLQEKMALFWHNHFATNRSKILEQLGFPGAITAMLSQQSPNGHEPRGQIELFREYAVGNFHELLVEVAKDVATICFLDNDTNIVGKPQENFARELMELFTIGVDQFTEEDVRSAARVFTGWNLAPLNKNAIDVHYRPFKYYPEYHDTGYKSFSFAIYSDGNSIIPARSAEDGFQDGIDLLGALAAHPNTGRFIAGKLFRFFVDEDGQPDGAVISRMAETYYSSGFEIREVMRTLFLSPEFRESKYRWNRCSWPVEYVTRLLKEVGWENMTADRAVFATMAMGQTLLEPPNVGGWNTGRAWFSTTSMLERMNFAMATVHAARHKLLADVKHISNSPLSLLDYFSDRLTHPPFGDEAREVLLNYLKDVEWPPDDANLENRTSGLAHIITSSGEYQLL